MYKFQLIRKYLFKRRIAWVALAAVMLCTAMVLIVVSVMSGWLRTFEDSFHAMSSDVVISGKSELGGFQFYQEMIDGIRKLPDVQAAVPIISTGGLLNIDNRAVKMVQVVGYPPDIGTVNDWPTSLHLNLDDRKKQLDEALQKPGLTDDERARLTADLQHLPFSLHPELPYEFYAPSKARNVRNRPGMIPSSDVLEMRPDKGPEADEMRRQFYRWPVTLTMVPVTGGEQVSAESIVPYAFWIVDDSHSRIWQTDSNKVYISFDDAQKYLRMNGDNGEDARCSEVQIKGKPGFDLNKLRDEVVAVTDKVREHHAIQPWYDFEVQTWIEQQGTFIKAVQKEVVLTTALFSIISLVAVLLIFCIFYMIVVEKTKDIGIIQSAGATPGGIMMLFLGYGGAIGVIGSGMGVVLAYFLVRYINEIHAWLGQFLGITMWTAETYQFDTIPSHIDLHLIVWVVAVAVVSALLGALLPALHAASMNPVDSLRYE